MRPAEAPQSKLSIIPSIAILTAGRNNCLIREKLSVAKWSRSPVNKDVGIFPTFATGSWKRIEANVAKIIATSDAGKNWLHFLG